MSVVVEVEYPNVSGTRKFVCTSCDATFFNMESARLHARDCTVAMRRFQRRPKQGGEVFDDEDIAARDVAMVKPKRRSEGALA